MIIQLISIRPEGSKKQDFINRHLEDARQVEKLYCIPVSVCLAQAILESGWGESDLCQSTNNYFGIKWYKHCGQDWHQMVKGGSKWRCYPSAKQSFLDYGDFLERRTKIPEIAQHNYKLWCYWIAQTGYAGRDKKKVIRYKQTLIKIIEQNKLHLL